MKTKTILKLDKKWIMIFILLSGITEVNAQKKDEKLKYRAKHQGFTFVMPKGFKELDTGGNINCWDRKIPDESYYTIISKDKNVKISIGGFYTNSVPNGVRPSVWPAIYDKNYLKWIRASADTTACPVHFYNVTFSKSNFNADDSGEYCKRNYKDKDEQYKYLKVVFLAKKNQGHISLYYIYTEKSKDSIEEIITKTSNMINFKTEI